jgi:hypothetical protein
MAQSKFFLIDGIGFSKKNFSKEKLLIVQKSYKSRGQRDSAQRLFLIHTMLIFEGLK